MLIVKIYIDCAIYFKYKRLIYDIKQEEITEIHSGCKM